MSHTEPVQLEEEIREAQNLVRTLIDQYGLDFILRICASAAIVREADHRAANTFTGKGPR